MLRHFHFQVDPEYDYPEFRQELKRISRNNNRIVASLKEDTTTSVWRSEFDCRSFVVKRYNTQGLWHAIRRSFRQSRANNCWKMALQFTHAQIYTAANIAVIQEWLGPFKARSWFICEYIPGEILSSVLPETDKKRHTKADLGRLQNGVAGLFEALRSQRLSHGDLKASNILLTKGRICLIDLDAARAHNNSKSFQRAHKKDRARFLKNWQRQPDIHQMFEPLVNKQTL